MAQCDFYLTEALAPCPLAAVFVREVMYEGKTEAQTPMQNYCFGNATNQLKCKEHIRRARIAKRLSKPGQLDRL